MTSLSLTVQTSVHIKDSASSTESFNVLQENNAMMNALGEMSPLKFNRKRMRTKITENFFPPSQNISNNNSLMTSAPTSSPRLIEKPHSFNLEQVSAR